jgi:UDP-N-acetylmuramoylalanine--D-glutamate ligase
VPRSALRVPGIHNVHDALCAMAAVSPWVKDADALARGLRAFRGVKHRLEYLRRISGIPIYDDTAATSPSATAAALRALSAEGFPGVVLIAGGDDKNNDYDELHVAVRAHARAVVLLPGTASARIADGAADVPALHASTLEEALRRGIEAASAGDALLLSPGGAGFFTRFAEGEGAPGLRTLIRRWGR